jgi:hypothetical protein
MEFGKVEFSSRRTRLLFHQGAAQRVPRREATIDDRPMPFGKVSAQRIRDLSFSIRHRIRLEDTTTSFGFQGRSPDRTFISNQSEQSSTLVVSFPVVQLGIETCRTSCTGVERRSCETGSVRSPSLLAACELDPRLQWNSWEEPEHDISGRRRETRSTGNCKTDSASLRVSSQSRSSSVRFLCNSPPLRGESRKPGN